MATAVMEAINPQDVEAAHGAEPLDELLAELDATEDEWADGWALYGPGGLLDDQRKALLDATAMELREMMKAQGGKVTDGLIDEMAHADERYKKFLDEHVIKRAEWIRLDKKRDRIEMRFNRGQSLLRIGARMVA
jgi:hypothetical protein